MNLNKLTVGIVGTRGVPAKYGGFETFAQELSVRLVKLGLDVNVYCDRDSHTSDDYEGVHLRFLDVTKTEHSLQYYAKSLEWALKENKVIIICGNSGALFLYKRWWVRNEAVIAINTDGVEHRRTKWSFPVRVFLRIVEIIAVRFSDYVIADSAGIRSYVLGRYGKRTDKKIEVIEYGADLNEHRDDAYLATLGLEHNAYYLVVSRLEPENNVDLIIKGYLKEKRAYKLVIVGNLLDTAYVKSLHQYAGENVIFIGGIYDKDKLDALRYSCRAYFHGHSVGGTNPSLLEALGSGNIVIAHDNLFNRAVTDDKMLYFKNAVECSSAIEQFEQLNDGEKEHLKAYAGKKVKDYYNWDLIAQRYFQFIQKINR